jgi:hypothetical protein
VKKTPARNNMYDRRDIAFQASYRVDHLLPLAIASQV